MYDDLGNALYKSDNKKKLNKDAQSKRTGIGREKRILLFIIAFLSIFLIFAGIYWFLPTNSPQIKVEDLNYTFIASLALDKEDDKTDVELNIQNVKSKDKKFVFDYKIKILLTGEVITGKGDANMEQNICTIALPTESKLSEKLKKLSVFVCNREAKIKKIFQNVNLETSEWVFRNK